MAVPGGATAADPVLLSVEALKEEVLQPPERVVLPSFKGSSDHMDSYTQGIELSNACRRFYVSRVQVADGIKSKLDTDLGSSGHKKLDNSMGKLRREVVSLIDQDLSLMKQLLTLNERIEDLKWQRKFAVYNPNSSTTCASSGNILDSDGCILSDWEGDNASIASDRLAVPKGMGLSDKNLLFSKYLSPSNLSVFRDCAYNSNHGSLHESSAAAMDAAGCRTHDKLSQQRSTSDLGSSDELVNSVSDVKSLKSYRVSQADSSISMDCPSNSSSLKKSDVDESHTVLSVKERCLLFGDRHAPNRSDTGPGVGDRIDIDQDNDFPSKEYSHDSGIQVVDHNMEMII